MHGKQSGAAAGAGDESPVMLDAHSEAGFAVGTPFSATGAYDFAQHGHLTRRVADLGAVMLRHRLTAPPEEVGEGFIRVHCFALVHTWFIWRAGRLPSVCGVHCRYSTVWVHCSIVHGAQAPGKILDVVLACIAPMKPS